MRKNIYDKDLGYNMLKPIVDWNLKHSYRKVEVRGKENVPTDGATLTIIFDGSSVTYTVE